MVFDTSSKSTKNFPPLLKLQKPSNQTMGEGKGTGPVVVVVGAVPLSVLVELSTSTPGYPKSKSHHFSQHWFP